MQEDTSQLPPEMLRTFESLNAKPMDLEKLLVLVREVAAAVPKIKELLLQLPAAKPAELQQPTSLRDNEKQLTIRNRVALILDAVKSTNSIAISQSLSQEVRLLFPKLVSQITVYFLNQGLENATATEVSLQLQLASEQKRIQESMAQNWIQENPVVMLPQRIAGIMTETLAIEKGLNKLGMISELSERVRVLTNYESTFVFLHKLTTKFKEQMKLIAPQVQPEELTALYAKLEEAIQKQRELPAKLQAAQRAISQSETLVQPEATMTQPMIADWQFARQVLQQPQVETKQPATWLQKVGVFVQQLFANRPLTQQ